MVVRGRVEGVLAVFRRGEAGADEELVLSSLADQAAIALDNARRFEALRETQDLLQNVLASSTEYSIVAVDPGGRIVLWNEGARRNYGYSAEEAVGMPSGLLDAPGDPSSEPSAALQARAAARGRIESVVRTRRKDGSTFTAKIVCTRRTGPGGEPAGVVMIGRDITQEERHLHEREVLAWAGQTLAGSRDFRETMRLVARMAVDLLGDVSALVEVREGGGPGRALVFSAHAAHSALVEQLEREMQRSPGGLFSAVSETWQSIVAAPQELPWRIPEDDARREIVEKMGLRSILAVPLISRGKLFGALAVGACSPGRRHDADDLRLAEELARRAALALDNARLHERERFQAALTAHLSEGVMVVRAADERIAYVNPRFEQMFGYGPGELLGEHVSILNAPGEVDPRETVRRIVVRAVREGAWNGEIENVRKDGTTFWCAASLSSFDHPELGRVWLACHIDITERRRLEEANLRSLREKEVLLKEVHHRVKNNLQVISSLFYLQRRRVEDDHIKSLLDESRSRVASIALIHEQLCQSTSLADIDFDEYLKRLVGALLSMFGTGQVDVRTGAPGVVLDVEHAVPCALLVAELVSNSLKHAFHGRPGRVWVRAQRAGEREIAVEVADDGAGIPESVDFRASPGLGLQLVLSLTKQLGGSIELDRSGGTRVLVRFPIPAAQRGADRI